MFSVQESLSLALKTLCANHNHLRHSEEKNGSTKKDKGSSIMQALQLLQLVKRHISG